MLGSCSGDAFSSSDPPPSGSGGADAGESGAAGARIEGGAGAMGSAGQGGRGSSGESDGGAGGDGAAGDRGGGAGGGGAAGDDAGGEGGGLVTRTCNVTCCNGEERTHTTLDGPLCVSSGLADPFCAERGGLERVEFDDGVVWEDDECALGDHNCVATCCDGSRSYITQEAENECAFYGMYACEHDGGPVGITFEGRTVFTADVECPTARTCVLECCDGFRYDRSPGFGTNNCIFFSATSSVCADEGHVANKQLVFGGEVVWNGACP